MHELYSLRNMEVGASREDREYVSSHLSPYLNSTWLLLSCLSQDYIKAQLNGTVSSLVTTVKLGDLARNSCAPRGVVAQKLTFLMTSCYTYNSLYNISYFKLLHYRGQLLRICFSGTGNCGKGSGPIHCPLNSTRF